MTCGETKNETGLSVKIHPLICRENWVVWHMGEMGHIWEADLICTAAPPCARRSIDSREGGLSMVDQRTSLRLRSRPR